MRSRPDGTSLTAGIAIAALGVLLLLDSLDALEPKFAYFAPAVAADRGGDPRRPRAEPVA